MNVHVALAPGLGYNDEGYFPEGQQLVGVYSTPVKAQAALEAAITKQFQQFYTQDRYEEWSLRELKNEGRIVEVLVQ